MGCIIGDFKYIVKVADNIAKSELNKKNIPVLSQHIIIFHIINNQQILFNTIQRELQCSKSTLSDAINKYEELGFMEKFECPEDKRNLYIGLTSQGKKVLNQLISIDNKVKSLLFQGFNDKDSRQTEVNIHKMVDNLK